MTIPRPCLEPGCGAHALGGPRCPAHERAHQRARNARRAQYRGAWKMTSRRARAAQPWCSRCGSPTDLTLDHETGAVECRRCNSSHRRNVGGDAA